jgi:small subunit ribosomal protein S16
MLAIRMQRIGRKGHAMFRVVVQDARRTPTSARVVALLGSYDPHAKNVTLRKDKAAYYLEHGAQPSDRVIKLFVSEGVRLPIWVKQSAADKKRTTRNPDKLRKNQPKDAQEASAAEPATEAVEQPEKAAQPQPTEEETPVESPKDAPSESSEEAEAK